ncbi:MAG: carbohydrate kinase, YjeF related protein [Acidobacteriaceae bacterium]|nr:carbohydrate kinase, YjeF related protein [Acidobacteriaceae bacterium]
MQILTAAEMGETDRRTAQDFGIALEKLMDRAGAAVATFCLRQYPEARRVAVFCGKGNNGGDGLVAARHLAKSGRSVWVLLTGVEGDFKGEAKGALDRLKLDEPAISIETLAVEALMDEALEWAELIVDAVVGTGFKPPLRGIAAVLQEKIAGVTVPVVAVDLPSGWDADSIEQAAEGAFRANGVATFTAPKRAHVFGHLAGGTFGPIVVAPIGSPEGAVVSTEGLRWAGTAKSIAEKPRAVNSNKGKFGHVLIVGGSYGKAGAAMMASLSGLRTGAGLVTAAVPQSIVDTVARATPELMVLPLDQGDEGAVALKNLDPGKFQDLLKKISVLAVGPGISTEGDASEFARKLVASTSMPIVIDADALNAFEGKAELLDGTGRVMVLTPHPGEMARLVGMTVKQIEADRIGLARRFAMEHKLTLVLKGWRTLIAHPDGSIAVNTSGNPAMSKGGSGDILTGIVAAMLSQYPDDVAQAVEAAVYLHGLAADLAVQEQDEHTLLATDTVAYLSHAFQYRITDSDGFTWICGINSSEPHNGKPEAAMRAQQ